MNLKELLEKATPLPWTLGETPLAGHLHLTPETRPRYAQSAIDMIELNDANHRLMQHAANILPELVEALDRALDIIEDLQYPADYPAKDFRTLLKKANNINIKKGN